LSGTDPDGHHQECSTTSSSSTDDSGTIHVTVTLKCVEVADNFWQIPGAWLQNVKQTMDHNAIAHQPPPQKPSDNQALQDINNIMTGMVPAGFSAKFGWRNGPKWRQAVRDLMKPGTHEMIAGEVPTRAEATEMIQQGGGEIQRGGAGEPMDPGEEFGHDPGGVSDHTYPHINYETPSGVKATVRVEP